MSFINLKIDTNPNLNFWELNPHLIYVYPYSKLYEEDKSKTKNESSKTMWCITWMSHPDEDVNRYYRLNETDRLNTCLKFHPSFDMNNEIIKECYDVFPEHCLSTIEKALKGEKEFLIKRGEFLRNAEYNYDTMTALDNAVSKTSKIIEQFDSIYQKFIESKKKTVTLIGGRQQTAREKNQIKPGLIEDDD